MLFALLAPILAQVSTGAPPSIADKMLEHGTVGLVCIVLFYALKKKDDELTAERAARVADAKAFTDLALKLKGEDFESKQRIESLIDEIEKRGA